MTSIFTLCSKKIIINYKLSNDLNLKINEFLHKKRFCKICSPKRYYFEFETKNRFIFFKCRKCHDPNICGYHISVNGVCDFCMTS